MALDVLAFAALILLLLVARRYWLDDPFVSTCCLFVAVLLGISLAAKHLVPVEMTQLPTERIGSR